MCVCSCGFCILSCPDQLSRGIVLARMYSLCFYFLTILCLPPSGVAEDGLPGPGGQAGDGLCPADHGGGGGWAVAGTG